MDYFVSVSGDDFGPGSKERPFKTISKAASLAVAGDSVTVGAGTYREWVKPANGGSGEDKRIVYRAAKGEKVIIKEKCIFLCIIFDFCYLCKLIKQKE